MEQSQNTHFSISAINLEKNRIDQPSLWKSLFAFVIRALFKGASITVIRTLPVLVFR